MSTYCTNQEHSPELQPHPMHPCPSAAPTQEHIGTPSQQPLSFDHVNNCNNTGAHLLTHAHASSDASMLIYCINIRAHWPTPLQQPLPICPSRLPTPTQEHIGWQKQVVHKRGGRFVRPACCGWQLQFVDTCLELDADKQTQSNLGCPWSPWAVPEVSITFGDAQEVLELNWRAKKEKKNSHEDTLSHPSF
eukprot:280067-Pelagomonas_calceolata.AAC.4